MNTLEKWQTLKIISFLRNFDL